MIASPDGTIVAPFTVSLSAPSAQTVTVVYATSDGSAVAGVNYVALPAATLTFPPGQTEQTVMVTVDSETASSPNVSFAVRLSSPTGAAISGASGLGVGQILAPGSFPTVSIGPGSVIPSTSDTTVASFPVSLSAVFSQPVTVLYTTSSGTAQAGVDYLAVLPTILTFTPGQTEQTVMVAVNPEPAGSPAKTFNVNLSSPMPAGVAFTSAVGFGTIYAPDSLPAASIAPVSVLASAGGPTQATFTVTLSAAPTQPVTVDYATADGTATAGQDYVAIAPTMLSFAPGQTEQIVTVTVNAAPRYAPARSFALDLSDPVGLTIGTGAATGTIDNPNAPPTVAMSGATVTADPGGPVDAIFAVTLSAPSELPVTVDYATADGSAQGGFDYVAIPPTVLTFNPGQTQQTVTVTVNAAPGDALQKFFTVGLSAPVGAAIQAGLATGTGTIVHATSGTSIYSGDAARSFQTTPEVSISGTALTASPSGSVDAIVNVSLVSAPSGQTVRINYSTARRHRPGRERLRRGRGDSTRFHLEPDRAERRGHDRPRAAVRTGEVVHREPSPCDRRHHPQCPGHHHHRQPQSRAHPLDRQRDGDGESRGAEQRDLHGEPVRAQRPAGDRRLRHRRRLGPGRHRLRRHHRDTRFRPRSDPAVDHRSGRRRGAGLGTEVLHPHTLEPHLRHDRRGPGDRHHHRRADTDTGTQPPSHTEPGRRRRLRLQLQHPRRLPHRHRQRLRPSPGATFHTTGKGKKKVYSGELIFTAPLDPTTAAIASHYHVTQKISKKKTATVRVLAAMYSAGNNSVTLSLRSPTPGKALQVTVSGLVGAGGCSVTTCS